MRAVETVACQSVNHAISRVEARVEHVERKIEAAVDEQAPLEDRGERPDEEDDQERERDRSDRRAGA